MKRIIKKIASYLPIILSTPKVDKTYTSDIYTSYFSTATKTPLVVKYSISKGGGTASRADLRFVGDEFTASEKDYSKNGYDIGHMANAEDFAFDESKEKETFSFYNALPQTEKLNRGIWKSFETEIRKLSQSDPIDIWCGGWGFNKRIGSVGVPGYCFKIYQINSTMETKYLLFPNDNSDTYKEVSQIEFFKTVPVEYLPYLR